MNEKLVIINQNTLEALEERDKLKIIERFTKTGIRVLSADFGFMFWKMEHQNTYQIAYVSPSTPYEPKLPRKNGYNDKASKARVPYFISKPKKDLLPFMKSLVIIPIYYKDHQYGNIVLCFKKNREFTPDESPLIRTLGNSAAQVLTIHRNQKKSERDFLKLIKQKDEFLNIASHELKTPVTTIRGYSQILKNITKDKDLKAKSFLEKIDRQSEKLSRLINDLLDISRIENGKMVFEYSKFEMTDLVKQVIDGMKVSITTHKIFLRTHGKYIVKADSQKIEEIIINLINNAAKYSPDGTKIKVSVKKDKNQVQVCVEDFGYGIPVEDKDKVFGRFFRSRDPKVKNISGLGLGLYISNSIAKHHGGSISFEPKKVGTIFCFSFPYHKYKK